MSVASAKIDPWNLLRRRQYFGEQSPRDFSPLELLKYSAVGMAGRAYIRLIGATARMSTSGDESLRDDVIRGKASVIFVSWHNRLPGALPYHDAFARIRHDYMLETIISASRDGEFLARVVRDMAGGAIRGSSSRDASAAMLQAVKRLQEGACLFSVGDGPRGPRYVLKPGPILIAKLTGRPILPFSWACTRVAQLHRAWDQMMFPLPFSRIEFRTGKPLHVPPDAGPREIALARRELESRLAELTAWADANTRVALQIPRPRPGEVLKRRQHSDIDQRRK